MPESKLPDQRRRRWMLIVACALSLAIVIFAMWWVGAWGAPMETLKPLLEGHPHLRPVDATAQLCNDPVPNPDLNPRGVVMDRPFCLEGWRTDLGDYLRFPSLGEAERWATILGDDGRQWKSIVLDMTNYELTFSQKILAIDLLYSSRDW